MAAIVAGKPLMLKEYLELEDDDDDVASGLAGARVATTIRSLLRAELAANLVPKARPPGKKALTKFSAAIHAVRLLPFSDGGCLPPGSLPERLRGSFWRKKRKKRSEGGEQQSAARLKDVMRIRPVEENGEGWRSLRFPSPVASSRSSWTETDSSEGSDFLPASMASSKSPRDGSKGMAGGDEADDRGAAKEMDSKGAEESAECSSDEEEKEQLSPVSVIDYPYQQQGHGGDRDDDGENNNGEEADSTSPTSPTFYRSLDNIERTKEQLLNRIRRFEMLAAHLDPIDLERCSAEAEDSTEAIDAVAEEEEGGGGEVDLLGELKPRPRGSMEKLLLDFFIQGQSRAEAAEMLNAARDWMDGRRCGELDDGHGEATLLREMEKEGRWRCFHEEEEFLAVYVEASLLESLVEDLVQDLTSG